MGTCFGRADSKTLDQAARFYYEDYWGFDKLPDEEAERDEMCYRYAQALCNAAGADGKVTEGELEWIQGYMAVKNMGSKVQSEIPSLCERAAKETLKDVAQDTAESMKVGTLRFAGRAIVFDAIRAASADGLDAKEKEAIYVMGEKFGLTKQCIAKLIQQVEKEEVVKMDRMKLIFPDGHPCLMAKYRP
mmetsp:Transcript_7926/g.12800  ORF Transcript_7926/g.12800 Transcript_7926/m.12800 type:complete len:189 (-) Transcript_7926:124-690(-)